MSYFLHFSKYHIFRKTKIEENIIFSIISNIIRNKPIEQDNDKKKRLNGKILYHADERHRIALTIIILL